MSASVIHTARALPFPVRLVCPRCKADSLSANGETIECLACGFHGAARNGFIDLVHGERFPDAPDDECLCYEESSNEHTAREYWVPALRRCLGDRAAAPLVLAIGCGTGVEVDVLHEAGLRVVGIEIGNRTATWPGRKAARWLMMANGRALPFAASTFDAVICGCVFPHVGVIGDAFVTTDSYESDRIELAAEISRVLRPGGHVLSASPNRLFPLDIFHGRAAGSYVPRINWPGDHFLLSRRDYARIFDRAKLDAPELLSTEGYWGFVRSIRTLKGRLLGLPIRALFALTSRLRFLRGSVLAPWIIVKAQKAPSPTR